MWKVTSLLICLCTGFLLTGCITAIDERLPYDELPKAKTSIPFSLVASPSHPTSYLASGQLSANEVVEIIGMDLNAAYLLVLYQNMIGWMPTFYSQTNLGTIEPALQVEPLDGSCTTFLGSTDEPQSAWRSSGDDKIIVEGSVYRPRPSANFGKAELGINVAGDGSATAAEYVHLELTPTSNLILFAFSVEALTQGSAISFDLSNPSQEPLYFHASFFSDTCDEDRTVGSVYKTTLPIGELQQVVKERVKARPTHTPTPADSGADNSSSRRGEETVTSTPTPGGARRSTNTPTPEPTEVIIGYCNGRRGVCSIDEGEILRLLLRWDEIHHEADRTLDSSRLADVLIAGALEEQEQTLRTLRRTKCYWDFVTLKEVVILDIDHISANEAIVLSEKEWYGELFCNGKRTSILEDPFQVRYQIVRSDQGLRIAEKVPLDYVAPSLARLEEATPRPATSSGPELRYVCDDTYPTRLQVNMTAYLANERRNNVRTGPHTTNRLVGQLLPGERINILDGPACGEQMVWWYVEGEEGIVGWTSEGVEDEYWLAPQE